MMIIKLYLPENASYPRKKPQNKAYSAGLRSPNTVRHMRRVKGQ